MSTVVRPKSELIWVIRKDFNNYILRYKDGSSDIEERLPKDFNDDEFSVFIIDMDSAIFIKKKYIFMNTITKTFAEISKDRNSKKGYSISEGVEKKMCYAKFSITSDICQRYVCMRY